ncbi:MULTISPECIES: A24 family peptidase [Streptomyces]|uniref:Prepilin peptidase n=1 Tax=Streptomyces venezuelae TaxID=54571 RepID=A0A5P2BEJ1_STRVZ|nr:MULTISPECIES: A24 family peptidase [Streptomyces]NEA03331.1 prepilin peptidase [Streptomyces sp. SID10116]MYY82490.1 prepilin peptidase [Streptomyces sp. SID335]MYZ15865.1 prepilin peptidase [Streptomyces sp. SID337]NEB50073.1 prepilin peptidase [Streptomyces sp. SID339]QES28766.1 prepilin peptidase [Streptomyces venezuelae]
MLLTLILGGALWGAFAGLFVPRAAYRLSVPPGEPWRAECPEGHALGSWLGLARCGREGGAGYGPRTSATAVTTALVCAALAATTGTRPELAVWLLLAPAGVLLALVDFTVHRLPDVLTLPLAAASLALLAAVTLVPEQAGSWMASLYGALALAGAYFVLFLINPNGMGFGDVKLALGLGAVLGWYGWGVLLVGTFAGFLLASLYGAALVVARRASRKTAIPFGPFLIGGAFVGLLLGGCTA